MCVFPGSKGLLNNHNLDNWAVNGEGGGGVSLGWIRACLLIFKKRHFSFYDESKQIWSKNKCVIFCSRLNLDQGGGGGGAGIILQNLLGKGILKSQRRRA